MKFGGTSVGTVASLRNVKKIVEEAATEPVIVVVSALGGVTDLLLRAAREACACNREWQQTYDLIVSRHHDVVFSELVALERQQEVWSGVEILLKRLKDYYTGIELLEDFSDRTQCNVVSMGERMSSFIISHIIKDARLFYSPDFIKTEKWFDKNIAATPLTDRLICETFRDFAGPVAIAPGFISTDAATGDITNLGRGGSDYTAALLAASLGAQVLDIWTDVDGFMTADPRIIKDAEVIPHLSFLESMDLCNFGAKVIYPPTIYPVFHKNIPIRILNTFNPSAPGTLITDEHHDVTDHTFRGVTSIAATSLITAAPDSRFPLPELHSRVLNVLSKQGVEILLTSAASPTSPLKLAVRATDAPRALRALREDFAPELSEGTSPVFTEREDVSTISVVGENIKLHPDISLKLLGALNGAGIDVPASATGASGFTFSMLVNADRHQDALRTLHALIFH